MKIKLEFRWAPNLLETTYSYKDGILTVDDFSFRFPDGEDGEAVGISEESGGKILQAYRKDGENYAIIHYLCKSSTHPNATGEFFEVAE